MLTRMAAELRKRLMRWPDVTWESGEGGCRILHRQADTKLLDIDIAPATVHHGGGRLSAGWRGWRRCRGRKTRLIAQDRERGSWSGGCFGASKRHAGYAVPATPAAESKLHTSGHSRRDGGIMPADALCHTSYPAASIRPSKASKLFASPPSPLPKALCH